MLLIALLFVLAPAAGAYRHEGRAVLPEPSLTPGSVVIVDKAKLCPHADTKALRDVTEAEKREVYREYGVKEVSGRYSEVDHLISLIKWPNSPDAIC